MPQATIELIDKLLLERISLAGIALSYRCTKKLIMSHTLVGGYRYQAALSKVRLLLKLHRRVLRWWGDRPTASVTSELGRLL